MDGGSNTRRARRYSRPGLEGLERRALLSVAPAGAVAAQATTTTTEVPSNDLNRLTPLRRVVYTTPAGAHVVIQIYGDGNLDGTTVDPDGGLNLRFSETNEESGIVASVRGGGGTAPLRSVQSLTMPSGSLSGVGGSLINIVNLQGFNLVAGGRIDLEAGVHLLFLNSIASDSEVNVRELPETAGSPTDGGLASLASAAASATSSSGTTSSSSGFSFPTSATLDGQTLTFAYDAEGGQTLSGVSGTFVPGTNVVEQNIEYGSPNPQPGMPPGPPGVVIKINAVTGPERDSQRLGDPQLFSYDPTTNELIRFDAANGNPTLTIPNALPVPTSAAGVALADVDGTEDVLIDDGSNIHVFDANTGAAVGQFSLSALKASTGLANPSRLGTFDNITVIGDPTGGVNGLGALEPINVAASLASGNGQAQPLLDQSGNPVVPYSLTRAFGLTGGFTGIPGLDTLYATGGAHFDPYQPNQFQLGLAALGFATTSTGRVSLAEGGRTALVSSGVNTTPTNSAGAALSGASLNNALGSYNQNLALITGRTATPTGGTVNTVTLYSPTTFARVGTLYLRDANPLTALTQTFYPGLANAALVDVQGNTQSFRANSVQGLVFNGEGNVGLVKIKNAVDTTIIGYPFGHAAIPRRTNVTIVSSTRTVGGRSGVTELPGLQPTGPLTLPTA